MQKLGVEISHRYFSFFSFSRFDVKRLATDVRDILTRLNGVGQVYVSDEGINAQVSLPCYAAEAFADEIKRNEALRDVRLNPEHESYQHRPREAYKKLTVECKDAIVGKACPDPVAEVRRSGVELGAVEWNEALQNPAALILDVRNTYESDLGRFDGARPMGTRQYTDTFGLLEKTVEGRAADAPIMMYCTGGIRCIKVAARLSEMGFSNVARLRGGIIGYAREIRELSAARGDPILALERATVRVRRPPSSPRAARGNSEPSARVPDPSLALRGTSDPSIAGEQYAPVAASSRTSPPGEPVEAFRNVAFPSLFRGRNYVFDRRRNVVVTDDIVASCGDCGSPADNVTFCRNPSCLDHFIVCSRCASKRDSLCGPACRDAVR